MNNQNAGTVPADKRPGLMDRLTKLGKNLAVVAGIGTAISTLAGLTWNLIEDTHATREKRIATRIRELTSFADFGELVTHYRRDVGKKSTTFTQFAQSHTWNCDSLLNAYGSGAALYYSDELQDYAHVREFYEDLGLLIRYDAIDFELVYQSITFPNDFVEASEPLSRCIGENWFGRGKGIKDFSFNMDLLEKNYQRRRKGEPVVWDVPN